MSGIGRGGSGSEPEGSSTGPDGDQKGLELSVEGLGSDVAVTFGEDTPSGYTGAKGASSVEGATEGGSSMIAGDVNRDRP